MKLAPRDKRQPQEGLPAVVKPGNSQQEGDEGEEANYDIKDGEAANC